MADRLRQHLHQLDNKGVWDSGEAVAVLRVLSRDPLAHDPNQFTITLLLLPGRTSGREPVLGFPSLGRILDIGSRPLYFCRIWRVKPPTPFPGGRGTMVAGPTRPWCIVVAMRGPGVRSRNVIDDPDLPDVGVRLGDDSNALWRVWAPHAKRVVLVLYDDGVASRRIAMTAEARGFHAVEARISGPSQRYAYALDGEPPRPDPVSRWQPEGVQGPSALYDPRNFAWDEGTWGGIARDELVFYELHVGTFTPEGTFDEVLSRLDDLIELGITAIELMPVGQFPGSRGWGYDVVFPFATQHSYGGPEALQRFVSECHRRGMAVVLDVILNHLGPEGNVFPRFGPYVNERYRTDWGPAINYDGKHSDPVRAFALELVRMWVRDFRFDGLRLDAADQVYDRSPRPILAEVVEVTHVEADRRGRPCHIVAETDMNDAPRFLDPPERGGFGLDGQWNDDFHHAVHVALTGDASGYFVDFAPGPDALVKVLEHVFVNNGTYSTFRDRRHGAPADAFPGDRFVAFTQNHDQVANGNAGKRHATVLGSGQLRLAAGILLLAPRLPLLFQGEEYGETNPFPYFCDFADPELVRAVREGRKAEFAHFGREDEPPDPLAESTRNLAVLSWSWDDPIRAGLRRLYRDLLRLRRTSPTLRDFRHPRVQMHGDGTVVEVERGGVEPDPTPGLRILLNLSAAVQPIPPGPEFGGIVLRSEVAEYGANIPAGPEGRDCLRPNEFLVLATTIP